LTGGDWKKNPGVLTPELGLIGWTVQRQIFRIDAMDNVLLIFVIALMRD
jgi:hypothetical protein